MVVSRDEKQQLLLGIRRANRQPTNLSSSVLSSDSMHIGILAAAAHAAANNSPFTVFYNPRSRTCFFFFTSVFDSNFTIDTSPWIHDLFWNNSLGMQNKSFRICYSFSQVLQGSLQQSNIPRHAISDDVWNRRVGNKKVVLLVSLFTHTPVAWHMNIKSHRTVMTLTSNCFKLKMWILVSFPVPTYPMLKSTRVMISETQWCS